MKIGIITQHNHTNYGNRLQNLAIDQIVKDLGHTPISLVVSPSKFLICLNKIAKVFRIFPLSRRMNNFMRFTKEKIETRDIDNFSIKKLTETYGQNGSCPLDCAMVGSDQTWNPSFIINPNKVFARFVPEEKRMSFSTSLGVSKLPEKCKPVFAKALSEIPHISVREESGAKIVEELTGNPCTVLLDPTLILSKKKWEELATHSPVEVPKQKYIFSYFLAYNRTYRKYVKNLAKKNNLKIVNINKYTSKYFYSDPLAFVKLIQNAELVCTNSFHGHAFSVCLEKPFVSFPVVKSTNSRTKTLLNLTGIGDSRNYQTISDENLFSLDYSSVTKNVESERHKAFSFLTSSFNKIKGENND